jgi:hypothetical protein
LVVLKRDIMPKRQKLIILTIIILVLGGGLFYWWQNREIKGSPEDYIIIETEEGKFVENKKAGLEVKVPEDWEVQKIKFSEGSVVFYTLDVDEKWLNELIPLENGCGIETAVAYKKMSFDEIKKEIKEIHAGLGIKSEEFEITTIDGQQALKNTFDSVVLGPGINICFSNRNKLYSFGVCWGLDEEEKCVQEFDKFLETVSIY